MNLPFFYIPFYDQQQKELELEEATSRHIIQVLRMGKGEKIRLTDGKGILFTGKITDDHKKHCSVQVEDVQFIARSTRKITVAISLLKNAARFEWFLEKATEIGIGEIIPMICERTEKEKFKPERIKNILVSSMLQSQQCWLPDLPGITSFHSVVQNARQDQKFIAHCDEAPKRELTDLRNDSLASQIILIGPEGDFTPGEIQLAMHHHFIAVSLSENRLRSETAALVAATILKT